MKRSMFIFLLVLELMTSCDPGHFGKSIINNDTPYALELRYTTPLTDSTIIIQPSGSIDFYQFGGLGPANYYTTCGCEFITLDLQPADTSKTLIKQITNAENWELINKNNGRYGNKEIQCIFNVLPTDIE